MHIEKFRFAKGGCRDKKVPNELSGIFRNNIWRRTMELPLGYDLLFTSVGRLLTAGVCRLQPLLIRGVVAVHSNRSAIP